MKIQHLVSAKDLTTMKTGGVVSRVLIPESEEELLFILENEKDFKIIGRGSNILIRDSGYDGTIVQNLVEHIRFIDDIIWCSSGTLLQSLSGYALEYERTGLEFLYDIPGTVGGAVYMNAGAWKQQIQSVLHKIEVYVDGVRCLFDPEDLNFSRRKSILHYEKRWVVLSAGFVTQKGEKSEIQQKIQDYAGRRKKIQPSLDEYPSSGTVFMDSKEKIKKHHMEGIQIGGAQISTKNPSFIINIGEATTSDILYIIDKVQKKFGGRVEVEIL